MKSEISFFYLIFLLLTQHVSLIGMEEKEFEANDSKGYYKTLNVNKNATTAEIKKAYYRLARQWHPDTYKGDNPEEAVEKFKEITDAYETLSDEQKRQQYDTFGSVKIETIPPEEIEKKLNEILNGINESQTYEEKIGTLISVLISLTQYTPSDEIKKKFLDVIYNITNQYLDNDLLDEAHNVLNLANEFFTNFDYKDKTQRDTLSKQITTKKQKKWLNKTLNEAYETNDMEKKIELLNRLLKAIEVFTIIDKPILTKTLNLIQNIASEAYPIDKQLAKKYRDLGLEYSKKWETKESQEQAPEKKILPSKTTTSIGKKFEEQQKQQQKLEQEQREAERLKSQARIREEKEKLEKTRKEREKNQPVPQQTEEPTREQKKETPEQREDLQKALQGLHQRLTQLWYALS